MVNAVLRQIVIVFIAALCSAVIENSAFGSVTWYIDQAAWQADAGQFSTITFTELPANTWITDQYAHLGVHFTDGSDQIYFSQNSFSDNYGLNGAFDESTLEFDAPMISIAVEYPGTIAINLLSNGQLVYQSFVFDDGDGPFAGLISTQPFDEVLLYDPLSGLFVDNLHFGPPIPAPAGLCVLALAAVCVGPRRKR